MTRSSETADAASSVHRSQRGHCDSAESAAIPGLWPHQPSRAGLGLRPGLGAVEKMGSGRPCAHR